MDGPGRLALAQSLGKGQPPWSDTLPVMPQEGCECGQPQTQKQLPKSSRCVKPLAAQHAPPPRVTRYLPPFTPSAPDRPQPRTCPVPHSTRASGGGGLMADRRGAVGSRMAYGPGGSPPLPTPTRLSGPRVEAAPHAPDPHLSFKQVPEVGCGIADSPPAQVLLSLRGPGPALATATALRVARRYSRALGEKIHLACRCSRRLTQVRHGRRPVRPPLKMSNLWNGWEPPPNHRPLAVTTCIDDS